MSSTHPNPELRITPADRRQAYQITRHETSPPSTPRVTEFDLVGSLVHADLPDPGEIIDTLVRADQLVRFGYDSRPESVPEGQIPRTWISVAERPTLLRWIQCEAATSEPDKQLIAKLNRKRQELAEDSHAE